MLIAIIIIVLLVLAFVGIYNGLVRSRTMVEEAFSGMDVCMKKRSDLIPNIVEAVKGYMGHEKTVLENVVNLRNKAQQAATPEERMAAEGEMTGALRQLFALAEAYPELKADTQFTQLQTQLAAVENDIGESRNYYNATVREFNTKVQTMPTNLIAGMFGFTKAAFFAADEADRAPVKVDFN